MSVLQLFEYLAQGQWDEARRTLPSAREELQKQAGDPRIERLRQLEHGSPGEAEFLQLAAEWPDLTRRAEVARRKPGMLAIAAALTEEEWETTLYWRINDAILDFKEGKPEELRQTVSNLRSLLESSWNGYLEQMGTIEGTTAQAELGHELLEESFTLFHEAVDEMEAAAQGEGTFSQALRCAESASRRMMAVQALNETVLSAENPEET